ncbi:hypothetical protein Tco_0277158 [Tanacetum coccineum]
MRANEGVEGINGNVEGANGGALDFSTIIAEQLQNLLPAMLSQVVHIREFLSLYPMVIDEGRCCSSSYLVWIDKMEFVLEYYEWCHEMQKLESELWNHAMAGAGYAAYTDRE